MTVPAWKIWLLVIAVAVRAFVPVGYMLAPASDGVGLPQLVICKGNGANSIGVEKAPLPHQPESDGTAGICPLSTPPLAFHPVAPPVVAPRLLVRTWDMPPVSATIVPGRTHAWLARGPPANART